MSRQGDSLDQIARHFGQEPRTVRKWIREEEERQLADAAGRLEDELGNLDDAIRDVRRHIDRKRVHRFGRARPDRLALATWISTALELQSEAQRTALLGKDDESAVKSLRRRVLDHLAALERLIDGRLALG